MENEEYNIKIVLQDKTDEWREQTFWVMISQLKLEIYKRVLIHSMEILSPTKYLVANQSIYGQNN